MFPLPPERDIIRFPGLREACGWCHSHGYSIGEPSGDFRTLQKGTRTIPYKIKDLMPSDFPFIDAVLVTRPGLAEIWIYNY